MRTYILWSLCIFSLSGCDSNPLGTQDNLRLSCDVGGRYDSRVEGPEDRFRRTNLPPQKKLFEFSNRHYIAEEGMKVACKEWSDQKIWCSSYTIEGQTILEHSVSVDRVLGSVWLARSKFMSTGVPDARLPLKQSILIEETEWQGQCEKVQGNKF